MENYIKSLEYEKLKRYLEYKNLRRTNWKKKYAANRFIAANLGEPKRKAKTPPKIRQCHR
jgi:hypothetical protein